MRHTSVLQACQMHCVRIIVSAGVALGKCVEYGYTMASEVAKYLDNDGTAGRILAPEKRQDESFYEGEVPVTSGSGNQRH